MGPCTQVPKQCSRDPLVLYLRAPWCGIWVSGMEGEWKKLRGQSAPEVETWWQADPGLLETPAFWTSVQGCGMPIPAWQEGPSQQTMRGLGGQEVRNLCPWVRCSESGFSKAAGVQASSWQPGLEDAAGPPASGILMDSWRRQLTGNQRSGIRAKVGMVQCHTCRNPERRSSKLRPSNPWNCATVYMRARQPGHLLRGRTVPQLLLFSLVPDPQRHTAPIKHLSMSQETLGARDPTPPRWLRGVAPSIFLSLRPSHAPNRCSRSQSSHLAHHHPHAGPSRGSSPPHACGCVFAVCGLCESPNTPVSLALTEHILQEH